MTFYATIQHSYPASWLRLLLPKHLEHTNFITMMIVNNLQTEGTLTSIQSIIDFYETVTLNFLKITRKNLVVLSLLLEVNC